MVEVVKHDVLGHGHSDRDELGVGGPTVEKQGLKADRVEAKRVAETDIGFGLPTQRALSFSRRLRACACAVGECGRDREQAPSGEAAIGGGWGLKREGSQRRT
jgi:hypothetical protein